jgi:hypothetical protein
LWDINDAGSKDAEIGKNTMSFKYSRCEMEMEKSLAASHLIPIRREYSDKLGPFNFKAADCDVSQSFSRNIDLSDNFGANIQKV